MDTTTFLRKTFSMTYKEDTYPLVRLGARVISDHVGGVLISHVSDDLWRYLKSPKYWGLFTREALRDPTITPRVKDLAARKHIRSCGDIDPEQEPGPGLFESASHLASRGKLTREDILSFRKALIRAARLKQTYLSPVSEINQALSAIMWFGKLSNAQKEDILIIALMAEEMLGNQSRFVYNHLMGIEGHKDLKRSLCETIVYAPVPFERGDYDFPFPTSPEEKDILGVRFMPGEVRRIAVTWLGELGGDPHDILKRVIRSSLARDFGGTSVLSGAIDLLDSKWDVLDKKQRERALSKAIAMPDISIRKRAYLIGEQHLGISFLKKSLKDKAKSLRKWGRSRIETPHIDVV